VTARLLVLVLLLGMGACSRSEPPTQQPAAAQPAPETSQTEPPARTRNIPVEQGSSLRPVDESPRDPTFLVFRKRLLEAIRRRDRDYLISVLHPNIRVSFGDDGGIEDFKRYWKLDDPNTRIWEELGDLLRLGGTFQTDPQGRRRFCAPYVYSAYPSDAADPFQSLVVIVDRAELHEKPDPDSSVIGVLGYNIVTIEAVKNPPPGWRKVRTAGGKVGWIQQRFVRSHIDYRACFEKVDGDWKMVLLVAGD
jgi:hypothetical protein